MENIKLSDLAVSLKHRQYFSKAWLRVFIGLMILCGVIIIFSNLSFLINYIINKSYDSNGLIANVGSTIGLAICFVGFFLIVRYGRIIEKAKAKCLEDGVELTATSVEVSSYTPLMAPFLTHRKINVKFHYMNKSYEIQSNVWSKKYVNSQIKIIYSPTYDLACILSK